MSGVAGGEAPKPSGDRVPLTLLLHLGSPGRFHLPLKIDRQTKREGHLRNKGANRGGNPNKKKRRRTTGMKEIDPL